MVVVSVVVVLKDGFVSTRHNCHLNTFASHVIVVSGVELLEELVVVVVVLAGLCVSRTAHIKLCTGRGLRSSSLELGATRG